MENKTKVQLTNTEELNSDRTKQGFCSRCHSCKVPCGKRAPVTSSRRIK